MGKVTKRRYTLEFKQQAAELGMRIGLRKAADHLGVNVANVQRWKDEFKNPEGRKPQKKTTTCLEDENRKLQKENEELKKVIHILKRAAAFFSQDHLK